ncbi:serine/threonine protein kinase [Luteibacter anthropi]|uniref:serine/threonine-protein kinase n=1 Tax=Luteibacter anthropi TaxID=564369 RepID=UPI002032E994|nr:serine/threonine-protein kinase [Luteibacter anthropi]URX62576.1 serine/threonine protein kinase [Luteibacter anthropi]
MPDDRGQLYLRAKPIALAMLDLPEGRRKDHLASACGDDAALLAEVEWIIRAAETTEPSWPSLPGALPVDGDRLTTALPAQYRIERVLGEGGMGVVYLAERTVDSGPANAWQQPVALKLLRFAGFEGSEAHRRFAEERRILATLSHPHIAHLLDAGRTGDGVPYLAMEYVDGERIDHWCQERRTSLRDRIALFLKVCDAVQYAHGKLVIHRDLKPANILVTASGEPKLLDFGISRLLDGPDVLVDARTTTAHRALTLAYASPEQVRGQALDVRADVWSLGVVLYQLVCGKRPFDDATGTSALDLSNAIVDGNLVGPRRHAPKTVPVDIDAIVMKALRIDPQDRYASAAALAHDLRRYLDALPVLASQGRRWYRARLFARRHRIALGVASLVSLLAIAFVVTLLGQLQRVQQERDKTQAVAGFMSDLFEHADPGHAQGENLRVRDMLDRGARQVADDARLSPEVKAALLLSIGKSYNALDQGARAIPLLRQAIALQSFSDAPALDKGRAWAALARAYGIQTDAIPAADADRQALALLANAANVPKNESYTVRTHLLLQELNAGTATPISLAERLRALVAELEHEQPALPVEQEQALTTWALALSRAGQNAQAVTVAQRASALSATTYGKDDPERLHADFVLATVTSARDPATAAGIYERLIADRMRMLGTKGAGMSTLQGYLGLTLAGMGEHARAAAMLEQAYASSLDEPEPRVDFQHSVLLALASEYLEQGRYRDAAAVIAPHLETLASQARAGAAWPLVNFTEALNTLETVALHENRLTEAEALVARLPALPEPGTAPDAWTAALDGTGALQVARHRFAEARDTLHRFDDINRRLGAAPDSLPVLRARLLEARLLAAQGDTVGAKRIADNAAALRKGRCDRIDRELRASAYTTPIATCTVAANHGISP